MLSPLLSDSVSFGRRGLGEYEEASPSVPSPLSIQINQQRKRLVLRGRWETCFIHEKLKFCDLLQHRIARNHGLRGPVLGDPLGKSLRCSKKKMQLTG